MRSVYLRVLTDTVRLHSSGGIVGRCAACGFAVYEEDANVTVADTGDLIHRACWEEYAADNAEEFFVSVTNGF